MFLCRMPRHCLNKSFPRRKIFFGDFFVNFYPYIIKTAIILLYMKKLSENVISFSLMGIIIVLILFSPAAKAGAIEGINLCEGVIIPALLPVLILTNTLVKIFPGKTATVLFGLVSGYPAGAVLTKELYNSGGITSKQAQKIMSYNFCGGVAFIISATGGIVYKSTKAGVILYISCIIPSLINALFNKSKSAPKQIIQKMNFSEALTSGVESSVKSLLIMSAYIILFSALLSLISIPDYIVALFEITNGICKNQKLIPLPFCAFFLSFGGLCVHFQLLPFLKEMKIKYSYFLFFRLFSASFSYIICNLLLKLFPSVSTASISLSPGIPFEASKLGGGLSLVMILGCAVVVFDLENKKTMRSA